MLKIRKLNKGNLSLTTNFPYFFILNFTLDSRGWTINSLRTTTGYRISINITRTREGFVN